MSLENRIQRTESRTKKCRPLWLGKDVEVIQDLIGTREQKMASGYVVYMGRSIGKHKMMEHTTDMLRAVVAAALRARDLGESVGEDEIKIMWATANPFREQGAWSVTWGQR